MNADSQSSVPALDRVNQWVRTSTMLKIIVVGILVLVLLVPTSMVQSLITEREQTRTDAVKEVSDKWGNAQIIAGPVLSVPFTVIEKDEKGRTTTRTDYAHALPDDLQITGSIQPEQRNRGIYSVMLYNTRLTVRATLKRPLAERLGIDERALQWDKAIISLGVTDMKGIKDTIRMQVNGKSLVVEPGIPTNDVLRSGVSALLPADATDIRFTCDLNLNGSTELSFQPFGKQTTVALTSPWATPSFSGAYLPDERDVKADGFRASWKVLQYNRNFAQQGVGPFMDAVTANGQPQLATDNTAFGVKLLLPVDEYQKTTRSAKYAIMFILITFSAFFFVEILNRQRIHPIQYLLVGFAICLFYVLLLAISEHLTFNLAYLICSVVVLALISFYVRYVFQNARLTGLFTAVLALLYGFFYSLLQLEDYSLLLGSVGLLLILGTIMYLTRNVNWYKAYEG
ncbi:cell envelope integrity protein CreD [Spirosoma montaniterrae]|uniref:Cell envelope integrity protein CreD n=1 Tax=Spirosoma montaniterrae TaxID=1178516 RepID=A0A1P9X069_9BACT|nr:cell envelope integrity protein CreD [Spirosoma montaniterrae]AQG81030.1 hypothetical protein AWR27_17910 [Spirosoma montaniterrae]